MDLVIASRLRQLEEVKSGRLHRLIGHCSEYDRYASHEADISGPMCVPPGSWLRETEKSDSFVADLDIIYVLRFPSDTPKEVISHVHEVLDREEICSQLYGMVSPIERMVNFWDGSAPTKKKARSRYDSSDVCNTYLKDRQICYTNFCGNREMAFAVSNSFKSLRLKPVEVSYADFIRAESYKGAIKLALFASPWPHPSSLLSPFILENKYGANFHEYCRMALAQEDMNEALVMASAAEDELMKQCAPTIPLGRVRGCMRSRNYFWYPPSGWVVYC